MATIFQKFSFNKNAFLNPSDITEKISGFPEVCITTFSENMIKDFVKNNPAKIIANLYSANGTIPVYEIKYADKKKGLFFSRVGASACAAGLEEIIALGAKKKVIQCVSLVFFLVFFDFFCQPHRILYCEAKSTSTFMG